MKRVPYLNLFCSLLPAQGGGGGVSPSAASEWPPSAGSDWICVAPAVPASLSSSRTHVWSVLRHPNGHRRHSGPRWRREQQHHLQVLVPLHHHRPVRTFGCDVPPPGLSDTVSVEEPHSDDLANGAQPAHPLKDPIERPPFPLDHDRKDLQVFRGNGSPFCGVSPTFHSTKARTFLGARVTTPSQHWTAA